MAKNRHILSSILCLVASAASAQYAPTSTHNNSFFNVSQVDLGLSLGSNGVGVNLHVPVNQWVAVRAGVDYMPRVVLPMTFDLMAYAGDADDLNNAQKQDDKFDKMSELMESFTGFKVDRKVDMNAKGTMLDFKLLVDIYPLRNKHWYATAGFYYGNSKVGHVENTIGEMPSLIGVMMYNNLYDYFYNYTYMDEPFYNGVWLDPDVGDTMREKFVWMGRVGAHVGDYPDGSHYMMLPNEEGMVKADMFVNRFKPYLGIGYQTTVSKDGKWNIGFDAGALFWGKPRILTHEGVNLAEDVDNIGGKVGDYVTLAKAVHVYPSINFRISYKLF